MVLSSSSSIWASSCSWWVHNLIVNWGWLLWGCSNMRSSWRRFSLWSWLRISVLLLFRIFIVLLLECFFLRGISQFHLFEVWRSLQAWSSNFWLLWRLGYFLWSNFNLSLWGLYHWLFNNLLLIIFRFDRFIFFECHSVIFSCNNPISDWYKIWAWSLNILFWKFWRLSTLLNIKHSFTIDILWVIFLDGLDCLCGILQNLILHIFFGWLHIK